MTETGSPAAPTRWFTPTPSTWIVGAILALLLTGATVTTGPSGLLLVLGTVAVLTALYVVITGRRSWASIPSRKIGAITLAGALILALAGGAVAGQPGPDAIVAEALIVDESAAPVADDPALDGTALALLATIPTRGKAPQSGYDRTEMFGTAWLDVDRNGCDTRNDILARDVTAAVKSGSCRVLTGNLVSPYTAATIAFERGSGTSALVHIDHVVALSNAWQTGAQQLTQAQRVSFANDPMNLLAVDGRSNARKGAGDTATWLPPNKDFRCAYVARQASVKAAYGLWVTPAERDAMERVLESCSGEPALTPSVSTAPAPSPSPSPSEVYYANCDAVAAAGAAPLQAGQPGYAAKLDRDQDGIACDT